jgi:DnaJ-class molecular chaperone
MVEKDYYVILGVPPTATAEGIRQAFRRLAHEHHPDRTGSAGKERFEQIAEAYTTLSDPEKRHRYNRWLSDRDRLAAAAVEPVEASPAPAPEPLVPEPVSVLRSFDTYRPSKDAIRQRFRRNYGDVEPAKGETVEPLTLEILLHTDEAERGGVLPIRVPTFRACPLCEGSGSDWGFPCLFCGTEGLIEEEREVRLKILPGICDNSLFELPISGLGIHNFYLRVLIRIGH